MRIKGQARPSNNPKIECRYCGCRMSTVVNSQAHEVFYHGKRRTIIKRYRQCRHCGLAYTTIEVYEDEDNKNLPEGVQPFGPPLSPSISPTVVPTIPSFLPPLAEAMPSSSGGVNKPKAPPPSIPKASTDETGPSLPPKKRRPPVKKKTRRRKK